MKNFYLRLLLPALLLACGCSAASPQAILWNTPNGTLPDFAVAYTNGQNVQLSWNTWIYGSYVNANVSLVDLWVVNVGVPQVVYAEKIQKNINLLVPGGTFLWTINIPDQAITTINQYVLRFKYPADAYSNDTPNLASTPFFVAPRVNNTSSTSSPNQSTGTVGTVSTGTQSTNTQQTGAQSSINQSTVFGPTTSPSSSTGSNDSSQAIKIGVGVGVSVGATALIVIAVLLFLLLRQKKQQTNNYLGDSIIPPVYRYDSTPKATSLNQQSHFEQASFAEMEHNSSVNGSQVHEVVGDKGRIHGPQELP